MVTVRVVDDGPDVPRERDRPRAALWVRTPAVLLDRHLRVLCATPLARALSPHFLDGADLARSTFLEARHLQDLPCWREAAEQVTALLSASLDRHEGDREFRSIVGELSVSSPAFAAAWARDAPVRGSGAVRFLGTAVGTVPLDYRLIRPPQDDECTLLLFEPADLAARRALERLAVTVREPPRSA